MLRICFIVESGTDVRLLEGLASQAKVCVLARSVVGGKAVNHPPNGHVPIEMGPTSRFRFAVFAAWHLWQRRDDYDVILVQGSGVAALAANAVASLTGTPTCMLICSPAEEYYRCRQIEPNCGKRFRWTEWLGLRALESANTILGQRYVALSQHLADMIRGRHPRCEVAIIPVYGVDTSLFAPAPQPKQELKRALGLPEQGRLIFFSSRLAPEKDAGSLLAAMRQLRAAGADIWLLHRSGGYREFLQLALQHGVADRVLAGDALHPIHELPAHYQACDLCVQTSHAEGLGFSPLEALACEVPVVATAVGGLIENIRDGETGWTCPPRNPELLARQIACALDDSVEAGRRARQGRLHVQANFERATVFGQLTRFFEACVRMPPSQLPVDTLPAPSGEVARPNSSFFRDPRTKRSRPPIKHGCFPCAASLRPR